MNVTILPYIVIGENCLTGAGVMFTGDIPPNLVAYGNPAKVNGSIYELPCRAGKRELAYPTS